MKICWDNLDGVRLTRNGNFRKGNDIYVYEDICKLCGDPYLTIKSNQSDFCSKQCARTGEGGSMYGKKHTKEHKLKISKALRGENNPFYGRTHSDETKNKISKALKGRIITSDVKDKISKANKGKTAGSEHYRWKGGISKDKVCLYETYAHQLKLSDKVRSFIDSKSRDILEVGCSKCGKYYKPIKNEVDSRIRSLKGLKYGESRFYCSQECKDNCEVYGKRADSYINLSSEELVYTNNELSIWAKEVLKRANYKCEICGKKAEHSHHIQPKKLDPGYALDPDNGLAVCKDCHYKYGHKDECSTGSIANIKCKGEE